MLLIDSSKLDHVKATDRDILKITRNDRPSEYEAVTSPIKVKLAPDVIVLLYSSPQSDGTLAITKSILKSTARKFKEDYVDELLSQQFSYDSSRALLKRRNR